MFKNYVKIAIRTLLKHKVYSAINIFGLAVGMASSLLILFYVLDEFSYDRFHENADQIYRLVNDVSIVQPGPVAKVLKEEFPEIERVARLYASKVWGRTGLVSYGEKQFYTDGFFMADSDFFEVFSYPFISGNPKSAFDNPQSIVITEEMADKYFGDDDPLGKTLIYENRYEFQVTGVLVTPPRNTHLKFDFLVPLENYRTIRKEPQGLEQWYNSAFVTYLTLGRNADPAAVTARLPEIIEKRRGEKYDFTFSLQPITDIHLHSHLRRELEANGNVWYVYVFSLVAVLVLLIACINFMNLTTARSATRAKEIGLRKIAGAYRAQLVRQFLGESMWFGILALLLALFIVEICLPAFNALTEKEIVLGAMDAVFLALLLPAFVLGVGLLAGSYPAFFLSAFRPVKVLKGAFAGSESGIKGKQRARGFLVIAQFAISIGLVISTLLVAEQMAFIRNKNLGFTKEQVVVIPSRRSDEVVEKIAVFKNEIAKRAAVLSVTASSQTPGNGLFHRVIHLEGTPSEDGKSIHTLWVDHDFFETYQIEFVAGRSFSKSLASDATSAVILNETAVKLLGMPSAERILNKTVKTDDKTARIIGVVRDFHFTSLHEEIPPIVMHIEPSRLYDISARISTDNVAATLAFFEQTWQALFPNRPFEYFFVDADYDRQYRAEQRMGALFQWFSGLAIIIACLGLFGLATFTAEQRTKEIGIRKVLGATVTNVTALLSKDFVKLVLLANLIAWPLAWYAMNKWLQNFAYRIDISWWVFVLSGGLALIIALLTVSTQAIKAALANPVESLRYE